MYLHIKVCGYTGKSKYFRSEIPDNVKGIIVVTGSQELPKDICKDSDFGTWKAKDMEILLSMKQCMATYFALVRVGTQYL